jgi:Zn-dependent protease
MPGRSYRIGSIAGIPVGVSPLWLVIVALITWSLGASYYPEQAPGISSLACYGLGLASALLLFASILAHEFGHALSARRHGIEVQEIDLWLLGGVSRLRGEAHRPQDELRFALAGPAVTAVLGACFGLAALLLPASTPAAVSALIDYEALINAVILVFNLIPGFPLDGGRVLRSLLWLRSGDRVGATDKAASVGRAFGYLLILLGVVEFLAGAPEGLWLALIGLFIVSAGRAEAVAVRMHASQSPSDEG